MAHPSRIITAVCLAAGLLTASAAHADVSLPSIFGDHMVLQQESKVPVWGTADPGEKVTVTVGDHTASTAAGADGKWRVDLDPFPDKTAPVTMTVTGKNSLTFSDVLIGDVWLCSGQSNMEVALSYAFNAREAMASAKDPQLRLFVVARKTSLHPLGDVESPYNWKPFNASTPAHESDGNHRGMWLVCEPHAASDFSAVGYFFARALRDHLHRPIGIIGSYWGGTCAEAWTSIEGLRQAPAFSAYVDDYQQNLSAYPSLEAAYESQAKQYQASLATWEQQVQETLAKYFAAVNAKKSGDATANPPAHPVLPPKPKAPALPDGAQFGPTNLYNGMIAPLVPYAIKGVVWYQGESNTRTKSYEYAMLLPRLIADWRQHWERDDLPFLYVQISHFGYASDGSSALIREAQLKTLSTPNTAMVVTVDIPCDDAGHPRDKIDPGNRLALAARHVAYGEDVPYSGPLYDSMEADGAAIRIHFSHVGGGLVIGKTPYQPPDNKLHPPVLPTDKLVGFTIAGEDKKFVPADAVISGETVVVSSPDVPHPAAVRFAWGDNVEDNLYNKDGLPASPFRTDQWNDFKFRALAPGVPAPSFSSPTAQ